MPAAGTLYDVVSTANASDCKVTTFGNTGDAPIQNTDMGGLANVTTNSSPSFPSMESDSVPVLHQPSYAPLVSTPLEKSSTFATATVISSLSSCASITPASNKELQAPLHQIKTSSVPNTTIGTAQKLVAKSLADLPISEIKEQKIASTPGKMNYEPETKTKQRGKKNKSKQEITINSTESNILNFDITTTTADTERTIYTFP